MTNSFRDFRLNIKLRFIIISLLVVILFLGGGIGLTYAFGHFDDVFGRGIKVSGISLERLTPDEAKMILERTLFLPDNIVLTWRDNEFKIRINDDIAAYDIDKALNDAMSSKNVFNEISWFPRDISIDTPIIINDSDYLIKQVGALKEEIDILSEDCLNNSVPLKGNNIEIKDFRLDVSETVSVIENKLNNGQYYDIPIQADIIVQE